MAQLITSNIEESVVNKLQYVNWRVTTSDADICGSSTSSSISLIDGLFLGPSNRKKYTMRLSHSTGQFQHWLLVQVFTLPPPPTNGGEEI